MLYKYETNFPQGSEEIVSTILLLARAEDSELRSCASRFLHEFADACEGLPVEDREKYLTAILAAVSRSSVRIYSFAHGPFSISHRTAGAHLGPLQRHCHVLEAALTDWRM